MVSHRRNTSIIVAFALCLIVPASSLAMASVKLESIQSLRLNASVDTAMPAFIAAGSGLIKAFGSFFVVADDEMHMGVFPALSHGGEGRLVRLFPGALPSDAKERKTKKPDLESLALITLDSMFPKGALLAVPSGSKPNRSRGCLIELTDTADRLEKPLEVNFKPLFSHLEQSIPELNIEGATQIGTILRLFQRGNGPSGINATIDLDLVGVIEDAKANGELSANRIRNLQFHELGVIKGVRLGFTDAHYTKEHGIWFLAAAEDTTSTHDDGVYVGAVIGTFNERGEIAYMNQLDCPFKPEGLWIEDDNGHNVFYVVTDADNPDQPAEIFRGTLPI